jgi:transcriptional regulator with XRE-family HTH domain
MHSRHTLDIYDGRAVSAARALAGLSISDLAAEAETSTTTLSRLEISGPVHVAARKCHGHVARELWERIERALIRHGVELLLEGERHGAGARWIRQRHER